MGLSPTAGLCEDDADLRGVVRDVLAREGFAVRTTATGSEAVAAFGADPPDVLILDVGLPDADGRDVCQALRARGVGTPVLFLTARDALPDRLSGFHAGGDDYLTKPFAIAELVVRVQALVRRGAAGTTAAVAEAASDAAAMRLDPAAHAIVLGDRSVPLTPTEFRLLARLAAKPGEVVRRPALVAAAWPDGAIVHDNTLDTYVARLRRKLREAGTEDTIQTARGVGYRFG
ncbi:MAG TPA: response regulator transcription factor [Baekduia sp.]|uniref:response regulator transcription factor n=1 Tax=Baekduia sp. TaxID=2600305 RepID=UPI002D76D8F7|nr:response regulator transcription factor [Baekduia sp.]HET6510282.1 response regulator transcription factor [Baekduia sp.]